MNRHWLAAIVGSGLLVLGAGSVMGDDGEERGRWFGWGGPRADVQPARDELYQEECGACHFAYQPGLLPARSWEALMGGLADHFGENAELGPELQGQLTRYLKTNAADVVDYGRSPGIARSVSPGKMPLRISETRYFLGKHDEIPARFVKTNSDVRSFSNCNACHTRADEGVYNEHEVRIPGVGRWED